MEETERAVEEVAEARAEARARAELGLLVATASLDETGGPHIEYTMRHAPGARLAVWHNVPNDGVVTAYEGLYQANRHTEKVVAYIHDDVEVYEPEWDGVVSMAFEMDDRLAILGLGGATGMGTDDIYKVPYEITQLQRIGYSSNQAGWEIHGSRETGLKNVAVVDGFFMAVRTSFLDEVGGWKWIKSNFHCYDTAMSLMALRHGWRVKLLGLHCDHHGGGTSTKAEYVEFCRERGTTPEREHQEPHLWQYDTFRDVLPVRVEAR